MSNSNTKQVAIACQGGGSHAAFTAGALGELLPELEAREDYSINGLSGASGGAVNAVAGWYGLHPRTSETVEEVLDGVWHDVAARSIPDLMANWTGVWATTLETMGVPMPRAGPYGPLEYLSRAAQDQLQRTLERHIAFECFGTLFEDSPPDLFVSTVDVLTGQHRTFKNEQVTSETVKASAAVPTMFPAAELSKERYPLPDRQLSEDVCPPKDDLPSEESDHRENSYHWDGLLSHNPPIRRFLEDPGTVEQKPDEIWIVQINPTWWAELPKTLPEIEDRRNELAGNLSLQQEVDFVNRVSEWVKNASEHDESDDGSEDEGRLYGPYKEVEVERVCMPNGQDRRLDVPSKFNRSPTHIEKLKCEGVKAAESFLKHH